MPSNLFTYQREQIVVLWEEGKTVSETLQTLESEERKTLRILYGDGCYVGEAMLV